jgi:hypothetical protein
VEFYPGVYQDAPPDVTGRDVLLVDFSYKLPVLEAMANTADTITIIDHHESAAQNLAHFANPTHMSMTFDDFGQMSSGAVFLPIRALFDMERSGAMLAWDHFFTGQKAPWLVRYVQDRDLWRFKEEYSREVNAAIFSYEYTFENWDTLAEDLEDCAGYDSLVLQGRAIERKHFKDIKEYIAIAKVEVPLAGHPIPCLNAPYFWSSDAGHIMGAGRPFAVCYWDTPEGRVFSLRSDENGLNVQEIAKAYGGGGHQHAAGFRLPLNAPWPL